MELEFNYHYINLLGERVRCTKPYKVDKLGFHVTNLKGVALVVKPDNLFKSVNHKDCLKKYKKKKNKKQRGELKSDNTKVKD